MEEILEQTQDGAKDIEENNETRRRLLELTEGIMQHNGEVNFRRDGALEVFRSGPAEKQADGTGRQLAISVVGPTDGASRPEFFLAHERSLTYRPDGVRSVARVIVGDRWGNPIEIRESTRIQYRKQSLRPQLADQNEFSKELPYILKAYGVDSWADLNAKVTSEGQQLDGGWPRVLVFQKIEENDDGTTSRNNAVVRLLGPGGNVEITTTMEERRSEDFFVLSAAKKTRVLDPRGTVLSSESSLNVNRTHEDSAVRAPEAGDAQRLREIFDEVLARPS